MSCTSVLFGTSAALLTGIAIFDLAALHHPMPGSIEGAAAIACALTSVALTIGDSLKAARTEVSKEIKPTEAGSPVPETAAATSPRRRELSEAERNVIAASVLDP